MRRLFILVVVTAVGLFVSQLARAAKGNGESFNVTLRSGEMVAKSVLRDGGQRSFVFDFSPGRSGVKVGGDSPDVDLSRLWPSISTGNPDRDPDLIVVLIVQAAGQGEDQIAVSCRITRLKRTNTANDTHGYRLEHTRISQLLELDEPWEFLGGVSINGRHHDMELTLTPERRIAVNTDTRVTHRVVPFEFHYEMYDRRKGDVPVFRSMATVAFDPAAEDPGEAWFEVPVKMPGYDSSVIHMSASLKDIYISPADATQAPDIEAMFYLDRMLITNVVPSDDPNRTEVRNGEIYMSDFQRSVSLRYGKRVRIALARQENEGLPEYIKEYIEVRSLQED